MFRIISALFIALAPATAVQADQIIVAGGCFWCVEADFEKVTGVSSVVSGYTGGTKANPSYKDVSADGSGHFEAVKITYDPKIVSRRTLYDMFLRSIDPLDAGGQFCDRGDSYRTAIFVKNDAEKADAIAALKDGMKVLRQQIVTPVLSAKPFYKAEKYHQDYYKSSEKTLTRFGYITRSDAYKKYRSACGRDQRVKQVWGSNAAFTGG